MTYRQGLWATTALLATLLPFAAGAATPTDTWTGNTSNAWETGTNWNSLGAPTGNAVINITTNNPVQVNAIDSISAALTLGVLGNYTGGESLNINTGDKLSAGSVTLYDGSITGPGTLSTSTISGYGTISSQIAGTSFNANATDGTTYGFPGGNFVNGTPGTAITLIGQSNLSSDSFNVSNHGDFNFQGVTLTAPTLNGVSTNLSAGPAGGNNTFGLFSFTGANSTLAGTVNNANYEQANVTGTKLSLNNFSLTNTWATNVPAFFVIGAGGTVDNAVGNSTLNGHMSTILTGGALTNSGGGTFSAAGLITGTGSVSGLTTISGGVTASGGQLTVNAAPGGTSIQSTSWQTGGGANDVLDMKGTFNYAGTGGFLNPNGATVQLDGSTLNTTGGNGTIYTGAGQIVAASGTNTLNGSFIANGSNGAVADYTVKTGATLSLQNTGSGPAIAAHNFTMQNGSSLIAATSAAYATLALTGNFSFQQTDAAHAWTYGAITGLGPDLIMQGTAPQNLEVGGIDMGYTAAGFTNNFALDSLTIASGATVDLVDQFANATQTGWTSGNEALYIDALFDAPGGTLNLDGLDAYLQGYGQLQNGVVNGVTIIGAPVGAVPTPEPASLVLLGVGLLGIGIIRRYGSAT